MGETDKPAPPDAPAPAAAPPQKKRSSAWRRAGHVLLLLIGLLIIARLAMPSVLRRYVNRTLDKSPIYQGRIGRIEISLWHGAYAINDMRLVKMTGAVPVPLFSAKRVEFAVEWSAVWHRRAVGQMVLEQPELNFVDAPSDADSQTGAGGPWLEIIRDLFPFKINSAVVKDGAIHFRAFQKKEPVDVYLSHVEGSIDNLTNIRDETTPLITTIDARALAMDQAKFEYKMRLDPFSYRPTYHLATRLLGLDVTKTNNLAQAYGAFDFKRGWFDLVIEMDCKEGRMEGYVKPLFRDLQVFDLKQDVQGDNVLQFFWQALVGATTEAFKNHSRDQFGTLIPFRGDAGDSRPDLLATVGNVLRNAFVRAYLPRLQNGASTDAGLEFDAPSPLTDPVSVGDPP